MAKRARVGRLELTIRIPLVLIGLLFWFAGYACGIFIELFRAGYNHNWDNN